MCCAQTRLCFDFLFVNLQRLNVDIFIYSHIPLTGIPVLGIVGARAYEETNKNG